MDEGVAIATNVLQYIHLQIRCKTLFATHYRAVTELERKESHLRNFKMCAVPTGSSLLLSYKLEPGVSDQSYGLFVARMAGIPQCIIDQCTKDLVAKRLNKEKTICKALREVDLNQLTPIQSMVYLSKLKDMLTKQQDS